MIQCALRTKSEHISALSAFGLAALFLITIYAVLPICHGTPSGKIFKDYIQVLSKKFDGKIVDFKFRDKTNGWGLKAGVYYLNRNNDHKKKLLPVQLSSYYSLFLNSTIYRENCYSCKYACRKRVGDITIGDYWGIEKMHPDYLLSNGGNIDHQKGISCVLVNTDVGAKLIEKYGKKILLRESSINNVAKHNEQLNHPCKTNADRTSALELYKEHGYSSLDKWYYRKLGLKKYLYEIWNRIPRKIQLLLKK